MLRSARLLVEHFRITGIQTCELAAERPACFAQQAPHRHVRPIGRCPYFRMLHRGGFEEFSSDTASACPSVYDEQRNEDLFEEVAVIKAAKTDDSRMIFDQSESAALRHGGDVRDTCMRTRQTCVDPNRRCYLFFGLTSSNLHGARLTWVGCNGSFVRIADLGAIRSHSQPTSACRPFSTSVLLKSLPRSPRCGRTWTLELKTFTCSSFPPLSQFSLPVLDAVAGNDARAVAVAAHDACLGGEADHQLWPVVVMAYGDKDMEV